MTRINVGIEPRELPSRLLIAEHREITRIPNAIKTGRAIVKKLPTQFTLGPGHVKFFYNKLGYLAARYEELYSECKRRGFNVTYKGSAFEDLPINLKGCYIDSPKDRKLIIDRILSKGFYLLEIK